MYDCCFYGLSSYGTNKQLIVCYNLTTITFLALPESSWLKVCFLRLICFERIAKKTPKIPVLDRNVKITCGNCGTSVTKKKLSRHKSSCSGGTLYCPKCPNFFTKLGDDLNYIAKKHSAAGPKNNHTCEECSIEFRSFFP